MTNSTQFKNMYKWSNPYSTHSILTWLLKDKEHDDKLNKQA